ncbi:flagellar hook-length control protein FliK [Limimaricola sp.]|uniref:flagellar hook-length control protein FliK n=1 Tax=Limimaricola sp. TaxID=2211665 RepID=UPI00405A1ED2
MLDPRPPDSRGPATWPVRAAPQPRGGGFAAMVVVGEASAAPVRQDRGEGGEGAESPEGIAETGQLSMATTPAPRERTAAPSESEGRLGLAPPAGKPSPNAALPSTEAGQDPVARTDPARQGTGPAEPGLAALMARAQVMPRLSKTPPATPRGEVAREAAGSVAGPMAVAMAPAKSAVSARSREPVTAQGEVAAGPPMRVIGGRADVPSVLFPVRAAVDLPDPDSGTRGDAPLMAGDTIAAPQERAAAAMPESRAAAPPRPVAQQLAQQVAAVITAASEGRLDLQLDPDELGRVALQMRTEGDRLSLVIAAEQRETTELIRRHLQELAQEFRALGYRSISFSFEGGQGGHAGAGHAAHETDRAPGPEPVDPPPILVPLSSGPSRPGLDLRL